MGRVLKILLIFIAGVIGIVVVAAIALLLLFDPNDFRDEISAKVAEATGREFEIEGELGLSLFPWLAVEIGRSTLGNAEGFGDQPFASFEEARLSVRLMPLIFRQELTIGTASLAALMLNLEVAADGTTNWDDLAAADEAAPVEPEETGAGLAALDIADVSVSNAQISYRDAQAGSSYALSGLSLQTGRIAGDQPFDMDAEFDFAAEPGALGGHLEINGTTTLGSAFDRVTLENWNVAGQIRGIVEGNPDQATQLVFAAPSIVVDMAAENITMGPMSLEILGLKLAADVAPFSYAGTPAPQANLEVQPFSLKDLMSTLGVEPPVTADPAALTRVSFTADAAVGETAMALRSLSLKLDETTLTGSLSYPMTEDGLIEFDLSADSINVDAYMAPGEEAPADTAEASPDDIEIPVDLIRSLNARGKVTLDRATLSGMLFENLELGVNSSKGNLRLYPVAAELFDGTYNGDVRIDASKDTPTVSVNEKIAGVSLTPLARSMFDQENLSGTIDGSFELRGSGQNLAAIRSDLDGTMTFQLADGAWEGTDVWYQLRSARALFKKEPPPERSDPPRTEFSSVIATGIVTDGIFRNEDLLAELPFMQLTGNGTVDLVKAEINYSMQARVLERPEFVDGASDAELQDFTEAVIPLSITGALSSPSIRPDINGMLQAEVKKVVEEKGEELKDRLMNELLGTGKKKGEGDAESTDEEEEDLEDRLKKLFDN
ncbi:MAG TPA: AsmA family protein [Woeseiaceae bacterium]|nr:AsmA family protein [Woeseiaceae bacterium]